METNKTGEVVAALFAALIGMAAVAASHMWSVASPYPANMYLLKIGSWMPSYGGIGPYSGKETLGLLTWLGSWLILFFLLRKRELELRVWVYAFLAGFVLVMIALWPPVYHAIFGWHPSVAG